MLYLDTARLGLVSPSAKRALIAAMEFNQVFGAGAYFDELLMSGSGGVAGANEFDGLEIWPGIEACLLYTSPSPRDATLSRMPSSA